MGSNLIKEEQNAEGFDQKKYLREYIWSHYDRMSYKIPKGRKADLTKYAKEHHESINGMINDFLMDKLGMTEEQWKAPPVESEE